jgi:hypothetical protein
MAEAHGYAFEHARRESPLAWKRHECKADEKDRYAPRPRQQDANRPRENDQQPSQNVLRQPPGVVGEEPHQAIRWKEELAASGVSRRADSSG